MMNPRTTWVVLATLIAANILGASWFGLMLYQIFGERGRTAAALTELATEQKREENLRELSGALSQTEREREIIGKYFVDLKGSAKFLEELQTFGRSAGAPMRLENVDVEDKSTLRVDFSVNGAFGDVYRLIELLEATPYAIKIQTMNLSKISVSLDDKKAKEKSGSGLWSGTFSIRLLSFVNK